MTLYNRFNQAFEIDGFTIPMAAVKFYKKNDPVPKEILEFSPDSITLTSCQALKQAFLGDLALLTRKNIGCIAAGITFGLIDQNQDQPLEKSRVYTDIMKKQSGHSDSFTPPSPKDFTEGRVYACRDSENPDFCLFGDHDSGRFKTAEIAKKAIQKMTAIQPADTEAVFFFPPDYEDININPDVLVCNVRPVELTRIIQGYQFLTGERVCSSMGSVRVVNSDLIVRPYLSGKINFSSYCVGARLIAEYNANYLGIGFPFSLFKTIVQGMEKSKGGYPFPQYPGAKDQNS